MSPIKWEEDVEWVEYDPAELRLDRERAELERLFASARYGARRRAREVAQALLDTHPELPDAVLVNLHPDQPIPVVRQGLRHARQILADRLAS